MRSISFGGCVPLYSDNVLDLFVEESKKGLEGRVECGLEILHAAQRGRIDLSQKFNLRGFEYSIKQTNSLQRAAKDKSMVSMTQGFSDEASGGLTEDYVCSKASILVDAYEELLLGDELRYSIELINRSRDSILVKYRFDIVSVLMRASEGVVESIELLKKLCAADEGMSDAVRSVLSSGYPLSVLLG